MTTTQQTKSKSDLVHIEFEGTVDYARVHEPNFTNSKKGTYSLSLVLDTPEQLKRIKKIMADNNLSEMVFNPKTKKEQPRLKDRGDGTFTLDVKRDAVNAQGKEAIIDVVDAKGNPIPKNILIGNGSKAVVSMFVYQGEEGGVLRLSGIQVLDLKPFNRTKFKPRDGFTVGSSSGQTENGLEDDNEELPF